MNKIFSKITTAAFAIGIMASCSEETINGVDQGRLPDSDDIDAVITVDQETNQVTMKLNNTGVYPIWTVKTKAVPVVSTSQVYKDIIVNAGTYEVEVKMANRNGVCTGTKVYEFTIENTKIDFGPYIKRLTDNASKTWHIDGETPGHLGCGESGTDGLGWWSAAPNDKAAFGVYDNLMVFTDNGGQKSGEYTFDPSAGKGTIYVNKDITVQPYAAANPNDGNDFEAPAEVQNTTFDIVAEGSDLFLTFPAGTLMGYLPNDDAYNNPKFKIASITNKEIQLINDNGGIAWHYILAVPGEKVEVFKGFKYDSEFNLWKSANVSIKSTYFATGNDWAAIDAPEIELSNEMLKFKAPDNLGTTQWQGQIHIDTDITMEAAKTYDFSIFVNAPVDNVVTVKPHKADGDDADNVFLTAEQANFKADGSCFYVTDVAGWDGGLVLTLDFAGNAGVDFEITNIVVKDHANDDGTVLPAEPEAPKCSWVDVNSEDNLWKGLTFTLMEDVKPYMACGYFTWTSGSDWAGAVAEPEATIGDNNYTFHYTEAPGPDQWMAQVKLSSDIVLAADQAYDIRVTLIADNDVPNATVKVVDNSDDKFYTDARHNLAADEEVVVEYPNLTGTEINTLMFAFDFGGTPAGTTVTIKDIIVQTHRD